MVNHVVFLMVHSTCGGKNEGENVVLMATFVDAIAIV